MTAEYLAAIERALVAGAGRGLMLSARDMDFVRQWSRAGVPAAVVVAGIEKAFERQTRTTRGLAYAAPAVEKAIQAWLERRVGAGEQAEEAAADAEVVAALETLMKRVADAGLRQSPAVRMTLRETYRALRALKDRCAAGLEADAVAALEGLERRTAEAVWGILDPAEQAALDGGIDTDDTAVRAALRWKALRARHGLPALALEIGGGW